jgi:hypothetical protein
MLEVGNNPKKTTIKKGVGINKKIKINNYEKKYLYYFICLNWLF